MRRPGPQCGDQPGDNHRGAAAELRLGEEKAHDGEKASHCYRGSMSSVFLRQAEHIQGLSSRADISTRGDHIHPPEVLHPAA